MGGGTGEGEVILVRNLLVGNGINIQFDAKSYSTQEIVLRLLKNCDRDDFPSHIIVDEPYLLKDYLGLLFLEAREIIKGEYDRYCVCSAERTSLKEFKNRYASSLHTLRMTDIGFEDYYLIHDLACHKQKIYNPDQYTVREAMRMAYLFSIYNDGKLNELFIKYSPRFTEYLQGFDKIFTVNYDSNVENATGKQIIHLHGQFDKVSDVYDPKSMRNHLPDAPINEIHIDPNYAFLYSNPISTHCGAYKELHIKQVPLANGALDKMRQAYMENEDVRNSVAEWISSENRLLSNFGHAIQLRVANPELCFLNDYHFADFQRLSGTLEILGFSPWNDLHLFDAIDQSDITECCFYYHGDTATKKIKRLLPRLCSSDGLRFIPVKDFWEKQHEKKN